MALSEDGTRALSGSEDHTVKLWDTATGQVLATFTADAPIRACALSMTANPLVVAGDEGGRLHYLGLVDPQSPAHALLAQLRAERSACCARLAEDARAPHTAAALERLAADVLLILERMALVLAPTGPAPDHAAAAAAIRAAARHAISALARDRKLDQKLLVIAAGRIHRASEPLLSTVFEVVTSRL